MAIRTARFRSTRVGGRFDVWLVGLGLSALTLIAVVGHSIGRVPTNRAVALLLLPLIATAIALRPAWVVLVVAVTPTELLTYVPSRALTVLGLATLGGLLVTRLKLYAGIRSGMYPIAVLVILAFVFPYEQLSGDSALAARGFMNILTFSICLGLIAYHCVRSGDLKPDSLVTALLVGAVLRVLADIVGLPGAASSAIESFQGKASYIAAIGLMISFTKFLVHGRRMTDGQRLLYGSLTALFFWIVIQSQVRATWLACLLTVFLAALWTGRSRYWLVISLVVLSFVAIPVAREAVLPGSSEGISRALERGDFTTGRFELWDKLLNEHAGPAMPFGNGYGYSYTLSAERIFGFETFQLPTSDPTFVYPHNDFIYWTVEFGLVGLLLFGVFWVHLFGALRTVVRSRRPDLADNAIVLSGVIVMMFLVSLVDNSLGIPAVTWRFFAVAGAIFGMATLVRDRSQAS